MDRRDDPFAELERLFERMTGGFDAGIGDLAPVPIPVDVVETDDEVVVTADLPGHDADDVDVTVEGRTLTVGATTDAESSAVEGRYVRRERRHRESSRSVTLPAEVDETAATADYERGVLTVRLPKASDDGHHITVE